MTGTLFDDLPVPPLAVQLRDYQQAAVDGLFAWFDRSTGNPLVVMPTGSGKSLVIAAFARAALEVDRRTRVLVLTHVRELVEQNYAAMLAAWPGAPAGVCSAGLKRREYDAPVLFGGVQSTWQKAAKVGWVDLVVIDEAHLIGQEASGMYRCLLTDLCAVNPKLKVIGATATPFRTGEGMLYGRKALFDGVAYQADLAQLIRDGWLSPLTSRGAKAKIDTAGVHKRAGEFAEGELEAAAMGGDLVPRAVEETVARGQNRKHWLLFCCGIAHANAVANCLARHGVSCATVFGETPPAERDEAVTAYRAGELRALVNVNVLTTGFDAPMTDMVVMLRPTCSPVLYVQMVGRGLRRAPGKTDCLVLDFGGNVARHGPIDEVRARKAGEGDGGDFARECQQCLTLVNVAVRVCPTCGFEFAELAGETTPDHTKTPDEESMIIAGTHPTNGIERWRVTMVRYRMNHKPPKPATLCVEYDCGWKRTVREWVCLEHAPGSYPLRKAARWWRERLLPAPEGVDPEAWNAVPPTVDVAMLLVDARVLREPVAVTVDVRGEYPELRGVRFELEPGEDVGEVEPSTRSPMAAAGDDQIPF